MRKESDLGGEYTKAEDSIITHGQTSSIAPAVRERVPIVKSMNTQPALHQLRFTPKLVERSNMIKMTHLSKEEILVRLEEERLQRLHRAASNLKADMLVSQRCPLCTLEIPCKHFENQDQLYNQRGKLFKRQEWSLLS